MLKVGNNTFKREKTKKQGWKAASTKGKVTLHQSSNNKKSKICLPTP